MVMGLFGLIIKSTNIKHIHCNDWSGSYLLKKIKVQSELYGNI